MMSAYVTSGRTSSRSCVAQNIEPEGSLTKFRNVKQILASTNSQGAGPVNTSRTAKTLPEKQHRASLLQLTSTAIAI